MAVGKALRRLGVRGDLSHQRAEMVARQIARRGIEDKAVLAALGEVPRETFVAPHLAEFAYSDAPLPIAAGQTISQPYIVGLMIALAEVRRGDRVLEIGAGSGYASAVLSRIVDRVYGIERHGELVEDARRALDHLGYDNVQIEQRDGTLGWPQHAPYDAILVAAGSPDIPQSLLEQLAPGGRLVIPVGDQYRAQHLLRVRESGGDFSREDFGAVAFVPLIGAQGWHDPKARRDAREAQQVPSGRVAALGEVEVSGDPGATVARHAEALPAFDDPAFARLFDRIGEARVVLLGEATHGTSEFYRARAAITRHLVREHGFGIVAVEADWPDAAGIDRYVRDRDGRRPGEVPFARFPTWMWRNAEVRDFVDWLREHNAATEDPQRRVSFHGLDLYSLGASIRAVLDYLDRVDPEAAAVARERYGCLSPWQRDPATYGRAALSRGFETCEKAVAAMLRDLLEKRLAYAAEDGESFLDVAQNARLVAAAERYYRAMYYGSAFSWNLRDGHMFETLKAVMEARGEGAKAVVWAHNSHIGDASATEMGTLRDELNIGQLCREHFGAEAALVGFGTDRGTVAAASHWDGPMEEKRVRPALDGSFEALCRDAGTAARDFLLDLRRDRHEDLREALLLPRPERAIGVIYRPESELASHYFDASLANQFDLYLWLEETRAVTPLAAETISGAPDTYPFAL